MQFGTGASQDARGGKSTRGRRAGSQFLEVVSKQNWQYFTSFVSANGVFSLQRYGQFSAKRQWPSGLARSCGSGDLAKPHHAHQRFLDVHKFLLALVFFLGAVGESFLQQNQVAAEFELGEDQAA